MNNPHAEELAAAHALGLLDEPELKSLWEEAERDPEVAGLIDAFAETAALLAYDAPQVPPPPAVRRELMRQLPAHHEPARIIPFVVWLPYAVAACLMGLAVYQDSEVSRLHHRVGAEHARAVALEEHNRMAEMRLVFLEARDAGYASAKIMVAWDPLTHNGVISLENMPPPPPGHDYQLWVLDPAAPAPMSAGLLRMKPGDQDFAVQPVQSQAPGFAISLEPAGGRPLPTGGILFAVAPGQ